MNIFILDDNPIASARMLCDKHIVKMPVESLQLLCTANIFHGGSGPYKPAHANHPCTVWARTSLLNWMWLYTYHVYMCGEYTRRYHKVHKCLTLLDNLGDCKVPFNDLGLTPFVQCMPDIYKCANTVTAYRNYYIGEKSGFAKWKHSETPHWWPENC